MNLKCNCGTECELKNEAKVFEINGRQTIIRYEFYECPKCRANYADETQMLELCKKYDLAEKRIL